VPDIADLLNRFWGIRPSEVRPLGGGMNSETWVVEHEGMTYVSKRVAKDDVAEFVEGCGIASTLADRGFVTGRPVLTNDGRLVVTEHALALLEHVPGHQLQGDTDEEQRWIATTLGGVHAAGNPAPVRALRPSLEIGSDQNLPVSMPITGSLRRSRPYGPRRTRCRSRGRCCTPIRHPRRSSTTTRAARLA
jgi:Phosphotransferase enzyme family